MNSEQLYRTLTARLSSQLPAARITQVRNQALVTQALVFGQNCHLASLANLFPVPGQRENLVQRLRRWLANQQMTQQCCYLPLVQRLFTDWSASDVNLILDRTDIEHDLSILMLAAAYRYRALPLAWYVLPFGSTHAQTQIELLEQVRPYLPDSQRVRINLYGDVEFRAVDVQRYAQEQRWHWQLGVKSDTYFQQGDGPWCPLYTLGLAPGERRCLQQVLLTREHAFGPLNLLANWRPTEEAPRYVVSDQRADRQTWRRGRKRFWIEPLFRDWKSYGFDLERSHLVDPVRLSNLLLGMATATLWMIHVGQWVIQTRRRHLLEAEHKRDYSLFRLGRDYAQRSRQMGWILPVQFTVSHAA
jgi:hypothetical protein